MFYIHASMYIPPIVRLEGPGGQEIRGEWKVLEVAISKGAIEKSSWFHWRKNFHNFL